MIDYIFAEIDNTEFESIQKVLGLMCKENNINQERQNYKILLSNEKLFPKNNNVLFTSGSKKYLSFYGKVYLNKDSRIVETVHLDNKDIIIEPSFNSLLIICGGTKNSTVVENEEDILYFYIAPSIMLDMQDHEKWQDI